MARDGVSVKLSLGFTPAIRILVMRNIGGGAIFFLGGGSSGETKNCRGDKGC